MWRNKATQLNILPGMYSINTYSCDACIKKSEHKRGIHKRLS